MATEGTRSTRNVERTRRAILTAAAALLVEKGTAASLADISAAAGVSKGGLLHHFGSRDELLLAVVRDINERFRAEVMGNLDLSENRSGKVLRAYVRTLCDATSEATQYFSSSPLWRSIEQIEGSEALVVEDRDWWDGQFTVDGMDPATAHVVQRASEGLAAAAAFGEETPERMARARNYLMNLIDSKTSESAG